MTSRRIGVFVSGTGRHLDNLARIASAGEMDFEIGLVVSNKAGILALERARRRGLETLVLDPERELDTAAFSHAAFEAVEEAGCDTVVLAGFLRRLAIPQRWAGRVLNIHPALLPAFGGKGYYGDKVHAAVLERGCQFTGCSVHYVDDEYDHGPILLQRCIEVRANDTVRTLADRVFAEEELALPAALAQHFERTAAS
ncbi:MAG: phosphoribosylglycinamide formyltransferase [Planctomycetota bacterium]|nr:MAG: phosphoribosylglycinamide formyltransferase [Planctomycetota bacterium]